MQQIGYARVSTHEQKLDLQVDALKQANCEKVFTDTASGVKAQRPGLIDALSYLRPNDVLVVWKLDRLGRSISDLIEQVKVLSERGIGFKSLQEQIDTTTSGGKLTFHLFSALAEFERDIIRERTQAGLKAARARGKKGGRPALLTDKQIELLNRLYKEGKHTIEELCKIFNIGRTTLCRYLENGNTLT